MDKLVGRKILLVEDEYLAAFDLSDFLEKAGADIVGPVSNVTDAIALFQKSDELFCAVIDVRLQDGPSYALADILKASGQPFVFLTGHDLAELNRKYPGTPMLEKPVSYEKLLDTLISLAD